MRIVFMGTPDFAVPVLKTLYDAGHKIDLVVTQPDRPKGRGHKIAFSPVKQLAVELNLKVAQPEKVKEASFVEKLRQLAPDVIVVVAFGQILSQEILDIPKYGCVNLHASLLPKYRGAAPIHMAVLNGDAVTGNTTMLMDKGMDTGDILLVNEIDIGSEETTGEVHDRLVATGAKLMLSTVDGLAAGTVKPVKQDESLATYATKLDRQMEIIDWNKSSRDIFNKIRAFNPWPSSYTTINNSRVKLFKARLTDREKDSYRAGQFAGETKDGFLVATGDGLLEVLLVQPESKKPMPARNFLQGCNLPKEKIFFGSND